MRRASTRPRAAATTAAALLLVAAGILSGCAGDPEPSPSPSASETPTPTPTPSPEPEPILAPLTGIEVEAAIGGPALAAKIDNHPAARPQIGLESTDIVYEELVEGGLTRYVAVWHSNVPAQIGPVRSIRPMDPAIATPLGGMIAYSGGQQRFVDTMVATGLTNVIHGGAYDAYFFRAGDRIAPHNVILNAQQLSADNATIPAPQAQFAYPEDGAPSSAQASANAATQIAVGFSPGETRQWGCEAASGRWLRWQNGAPDMAASGTQLSAANVVVLSVAIVNNGGVPETVLAGTSGTGYVQSGCASIAVNWSKPDLASPIQLTDASGQPVTLSPGNAWVELVPNTGSITVS